jgi:hypothetical protein
LTLVAELALDHDIVLLTGRPEGCRSDTKAWLAVHGIDHQLLVMRPPRKPPAGGRGQSRIAS